jgi:hypothetical protein
VIFPRNSAQEAVEKRDTARRARRLAFGLSLSDQARFEKVAQELKQEASELEAVASASHPGTEPVMENAIVSERECYLNAAACDQMAHEVDHEALRRFLLMTARHWRKLGDKLKVDEMTSDCTPND